MPATVPPLQSDRPATLRLAFPPDLVSARAAAATVRGFFEEQGVSKEELFACELCAAEACNNAVEYATEEGRKHHAFVDAVCNAEELELRVCDHTAGFEWPKRGTRPPVHSERGRGLFIIRSFMDEVHYLRGTKENVLVMRKKRVGARGDAAKSEVALPAEEARRQLADCKRAVSAMARELCFRSETLSAMFRCCTELGRAGDSEGFEARLLADLLHLTQSDWYVLRLVSPDGGQLAVAAVSDNELETETLSLGGGGDAPASLEASVATSLKPARFDARACAGHEPLLAMGKKANGVIYPLQFNDALVGTLAVGCRAGAFEFGDLQEEVARTFAEFLAIQSAGQRRREEDLRTKLFARDLEIARVIQRSLLPVSLPQMSGVGLAGGWHCAKEVGGDFYDAIALSEDRSLMIVADVMGKGVPAALFATNLRGLLRGLSVRFDDPAQFLRRLNRLLYEELSAVSMFITAQVAVVDMRQRTITAAGAGHCPLLYVKDDGETIAQLATQGMPLGVLADFDYRSVTVTLGRPGTLLMHTDGLTEMRNAQGETFGQARLIQWLETNHGRGRSATQLRGRLAAELARFRGDAPMSDDQTFLLLTEERSEDSRDTASWFPAAARAARESFVDAESGRRFTL